MLLPNGTISKFFILHVPLKGVVLGITDTKANDMNFFQSILHFSLRPFGAGPVRGCEGQVLVVPLSSKRTLDEYET